MPSQVQIRNERLRQLCDWGVREGVLDRDDPSEALRQRAEESWPFLTLETMKSYAQASLRMLRLRSLKEVARVQASGTQQG